MSNILLCILRGKKRNKPVNYDDSRKNISNLADYDEKTYYHNKTSSKIEYYKTDTPK